jgi:hypothetical protein
LDEKNDSEEMVRIFERERMIRISDDVGAERRRNGRIERFTYAGRGPIFGPISVISAIVCLVPPSFMLAETPWSEGCENYLGYRKLFAGCSIVLGATFVLSTAMFCFFEMISSRWYDRIHMALGLIRVHVYLAFCVVLGLVLGAGDCFWSLKFDGLDRGTVGLNSFVCAVSVFADVYLYSKAP